jgi:hypothetical protein
VISKNKSPASDCNFLARYLLQHVKNGVTSQTQLQKILITEVGCNVSASNVGCALAMATSTLLFNAGKGYNCINPLAPPTVETLRARKKNRIESQTHYVIPKDTVDLLAGEEM